MTDQPEIFIVETTQPSVEISAGANLELQVVEPSAATIIEVNVPGPQGPGREVLNVKVDANTLGIIYIGQSPNGSADSSSVWTITRSTYNAAGVRLTKGTATGVAWTARTSATYL